MVFCDIQQFQHVIVAVRAAAGGLVQFVADLSLIRFVDDLLGQICNDHIKSFLIKRPEIFAGCGIYFYVVVVGILHGCIHGILVRIGSIDIPPSLAAKIPKMPEPEPISITVSPLFTLMFLAKNKPCEEGGKIREFTSNSRSIPLMWYFRDSVLFVKCRTLVIFVFYWIIN